MSVLDDILTDELFQRASRCERSIRVVAPPTRRYRGKQARRAAFYHRRRCARTMRQLLRMVQLHPTSDDVADHLRDALLYGMSALKVERVEPHSDIDPLTGEPWAHPWRVRKLTRAEFEREFPRHVGVDFGSEFYDPPPATTT